MDYLYHYCSIETFEKIVRNRTFRFTSLAEVDDLEEPLTSDFDDIGKICYVSCWTDCSSEMIEMWRSYTDNMKGVRIGLPKYFYTVTDAEEALKKQKEISFNYDLSLSPPYFPELIPVTYTKDPMLINLPVISSFESHEVKENMKSDTIQVSINTLLLGRFKNIVWDYQSEWRYRLIAIPNEVLRLNQKGRYSVADIEEHKKQLKQDIFQHFSQRYIDYPFSESIFSDMNLIFGPANTDEDNRKIIDVITKYCNGYNIDYRKSILKVKS